MKSKTKCIFIIDDEPHCRENQSTIYCIKNFIYGNRKINKE